MTGDHNVSNALAAIAVARHLGVKPTAIKAALAAFGGVNRRFTKVGVWNGVTIIDDYGHHPVEIAAVLKAARQATKGRVIAVHPAAPLHPAARPLHPVLRLLQRRRRRGDRRRLLRRASRRSTASAATRWSAACRPRPPPARCRSPGEEALADFARAECRAGRPPRLPRRRHRSAPGRTRCPSG